MQTITRKLANDLRTAFGKGSQLFAKFSVDQLMSDFQEYLSDRNGDGTMANWLDNHLKAEELHIETLNSETGVTKSKAAAQQKALREMAKRVRAVKLPRVTKSAKSEAPATERETAKASAPKPSALPKVGDEGLATESDFQNPNHPRLSDYRYQVVISDGKVIGRGFMAKVDNSPRRTWFGLPNPEIAADVWKKAPIREVPFEFYQRFTNAYLKKNGYPQWDALRNEIWPKVEKAATPATATA